MTERAEHTAGPWSHETGNFGMESVCSEDAGIIAQTYSIGGKGGDLPAVANARLIAAAPDLLSFAMAHDAYMLDAGYEGPDSAALHPKASANWRACRDVIARATGEA